MFYHARESTINIPNNTINYISFGSGKKKLLMIQGLNTNTIKGIIKLVRAFLFLCLISLKMLKIKNGSVNIDRNSPTESTIEVKLDM